MPTNTDRYWEQYLASFPADGSRPSGHAGTTSFGVTWDDAREIAMLVRDGTKTATGGLVWSNEADGKPLACPGDLWIVLAGPDEPFCIIETTEVRIFPYEPLR